MADEPDQAGPETPASAGRKEDGTFAKGTSGNPSGRKPGLRNRVSAFVEVVFANEAQAISRKAVEMAKAGDVVMIRAVLDRLLPPRRAEVVTINLPPLRTPADALAASAELVAAVAAGEIAPSEAAEVAKLIEAFGRFHAAVEVEERLRAIEARLG